MSAPLSAPSPADELECPPWCSRQFGHDLGEPFRSHWSTPAVVGSGVAARPGGPTTLQWAELGRVDAPAARGLVCVVVNDRGAAPLSPDGARALAAALVALADEAEGQ